MCMTTPRALACFVTAALAITACRGRSDPRAHVREREIARTHAPAPMPPTLVAAIARAEASARDALPQGRGRVLVEAKCAPCHSVAMITQQRKTRAGWTKSLTQMKAWGVQLSPEDEPVLFDYLAAHFGAPEAQ
jgi:hypothetical protein